MQKIQKRGLSLIEMTIILIIIGLFVGTIVGVGNILRTSKKTALNTNITHLEKAALQWVNEDNSGSTQGISITAMKKAKVLNGSWSDDGKSKNPFGGTLSVQPDSTDPDLIDIIATNIPKDVCEKYANGEYKVPGATSYTCSNGKLIAKYND